ncbi:phosphotransferase [Pseudonocardia pini]|uniref:phosphotransferase n=1 Tax=Pseudonocardia pini TaxID=2758030 RepID=UPI0015F00B97|nr:phosphotransferase [Pseudonocardia pini]
MEQPPGRRRRLDGAGGDPSSRSPPWSEEANPGWFTTVLRAAGVLAPTAAVTAVEHTRVGNGLVCESVRFVLTYRGEAVDAPSSVVGKFPSAVAAYREVAAGEELYTRETTFYAELASRLDVRVPRAFHVARAAATGDFVLVLEDLGPAETGDQIAGCSLAQAEAVVAAAAGLHAPLWGAEGLETAGWSVRAPWTARIGATYPGLFAQYAELFGPRLADGDLMIGREFAPAIGAWFDGQPRPWTLTHGDFRLDNMLFDIHDGAEPATITGDPAPEVRLKKVTARLATYLQLPGYGEGLVAANRWDPALLRRLREDPVVRSFGSTLIDQAASVEQLEHIAALLPAEWTAAAAYGDPLQCAEAVRHQLDLGATGVIMHGATTDELEPVVDAYRKSAG